MKIKIRMKIKNAIDKQLIAKFSFFN